ncbi:SWIM zinc finger family protein [Companilactobacillus nantensis]|uniref:SWIM-type domain-containing protein n=1 Tax=Companilactobacillus nantensis DSM 16982 TaxID=1423774 RepID=A0A0R1WBI0_9LACO|nr:SWIM zinc finger family protein [Companilactobacillus nantensis]KRM15296.1 hypothetical protein FD31_GL001304 [Companilactobacillus nantensis DSM 16982]GEO64375.1 hypothetical protein LNA01_15580 [Companilactobacillus nantensis]
MDWENLFQPQILERGYDYFDQGLVEDFKQTKTKITAKVFGSEVYDVKIKLRNGEIADASCDCPYAQDGKYCKHMVAVLVFTDNSSEAQGSAADVLVEKASNKQVRDFLSAVLNNDAHLRDLFQSLITPQFDDDLTRYKKQINGLIAQNADRDGFIDYRAADYFERDMSDFIVDNALNLANHQEFDLAFDVLGYVAVKLNSLDIDDSSGGLMRLAECCDDMWFHLLEEASPDLEKRMFTWFLNQYDKLPIFEDIFDGLLLSEFNEKVFLKKKLVWSEKKFYDSKTSSSSYEISKWAVYHVQIMKKLNLPITEINQFCLENDNYSDVRMLYINTCIQQKNYQEAIKSLIDGKEHFKKWPGIVATFSNKLKDVYQVAGQTDNYLNEMWLILTEYSPADIGVYREYKQQFTVAEWKPQCGKLFAVLTKQKTNMNRLYVEEKLWNQLLAAVLKSNGLYEMERYEGILKEKYPKEVLQKYEAEVQHLASRSGSRGHYRNIVRILNHMATLNGGYDLAVKIISDWQSKYEKRPAMLDELRGFNQRIY